ncbi:hypothetical protein HOD29_03075 [archaeon]|jgi:hypothetical protein|nr:hypothetical protein [archaeon]
MLKHNEENKFELSILIIAILIPVFLNSFPSIINLVLEIFPLLSNLSLNLIKIVSIIIGLFWLSTLLIGLAQFIKTNRSWYGIAFALSTYATIALLISTFSIYLVYALYLKVGNETIISWASLIMGVALGFILARRKRK